MASVSSAAAWTDTTDIIANAGPARLISVQIRINPAATVDSYVQLFNSVDATPGTTAPNDVIWVPSPTTAGRKMEYNIAYNGKYYATGLTWFVSTTVNGATAATTSAPHMVLVEYNTGG